LSKADIVIALILAVGAFLGYKSGFLMELFFLLAIVLGVFLGFKLMGLGVEYLTEKFNADKAVLPYISFLVIFLIVMGIVIFLGNRIKNSMDKTFLGKVDAVAGAALGLIKYSFCISILIWLADSFKILLPQSWHSGSVLYPLVAQVAPKASSLFADFVPFFKETFRQF
jgi:membrane protein required for colicin V production